MSTSTTNIKIIKSICCEVHMNRKMTAYTNVSSDCFLFLSPSSFTVTYSGSFQNCISFFLIVNTMSLSASELDEFVSSRVVIVLDPRLFFSTQYWSRRLIRWFKPFDDMFKPYHQVWGKEFFQLLKRWSGYTTVVKRMNHNNPKSLIIISTARAM